MIVDLAGVVFVIAVVIVIVAADVIVTVVVGVAVSSLLSLMYACCLCWSLCSAVFVLVLSCPVHRSLFMYVCHCILFVCYSF